jgi:hypothetical protein
MFAGAYITPKRLANSQVTVPYKHNPLALMILKKELTLRIKAMLFVRPFSPALWGSIVCLIFVSGIIFVLIEGSFVSNSVFRGISFYSLKQFRIACANSIFLSWTR